MPPKASTSAPSLPAFIQDLVAAGLTGAEAMATAKPLWLHDVKSKEALKTLTPSKLEHAGVDDAAVVKKLLGFAKKGKAPKRKRGSDMDHPLPSEAPKPVVKQSLEFDENLEEFHLATRNVLVNRAPVMTAWATVVAERLGFKREEALSIAQAYTELNATSKGQSLGIISASPSKSGPGQNQPHVELMGRKVPIISLQTEEWRGIVKGAVSQPEAAFGYIKRSFQQQVGAVMGAMRLLADSFEPQELNKLGYGLYCEFRPSGGGWGERTDLHLSNILDLRRFLTHPDDDVKPKAESPSAKREEPAVPDELEPPAKRPKDEADEFDDFDDAVLAELPVNLAFFSVADTFATTTAVCKTPQTLHPALSNTPKMGLMDKLTGKPREDDWAQGGHVTGDSHTGPTGVTGGTGPTHGHPSATHGHSTTGAYPQTAAAQPGYAAQDPNVASGASYGGGVPPQQQASYGTAPPVQQHQGGLGHHHQQQHGTLPAGAAGTAVPAQYDESHDHNKSKGGLGGLLHKDHRDDSRHHATGPTATTAAAAPVAAGAAGHHGHHGHQGHHNTSNVAGGQSKLDQARQARVEAEEAQRRSHTLGQEARLEAERLEREAKEELRLAEQRHKEARVAHKEAKHF